MIQKFQNLISNNIFLLAFLTCFGNTAHSQGAYPISPFATSYFNPHFGLTAETYFNGNDGYFSFGLGLEDTGYDYSASLNFGFRPYFKKVLIERGENIFYQYHEKLFLLSLDLEKRFYFVEYGDRRRVGLYAGGKFGYLFSNYKGVSENFKDYFLVSPSAGLAWEFTNVRLNLGYLYFNTSEELSPNMIQFKIVLYSNKNEEQ